MKSVKLTIKAMQQLARKRGGKCLSQEYINNYTKLLWECAEGHQWEAQPKNIKQGQWCSVCARTKKLTIEEMQQLAREHGGKCLSQEYTNNHTKLLWECAEGHQWKATPNNIRRGQWCPECSGKKKKTRKEMVLLARKRGGKCLSRKYINAHTKLLWECAEGHQWKAVPNNVKQGTWCPECSGKKKKTIKEMALLARKRGGKCLSRKYINAHTKLLWECVKGHQWEAQPDSIKQGTWCLVCSGNKKLTLKDMQAIAKKQKGKCLSQKYINIYTKLLWECKKGHQWEATPNNIKRGTWCPECAGTKRLTLQDMQMLARKYGGKCLSQEYINNRTKLLWECAQGHQWETKAQHVKDGHWCPACYLTRLANQRKLKVLKKKRGSAFSHSL
jgi:hypothetical protein